MPRKCEGKRIFLLLADWYQFRLTFSQDHWLSRYCIFILSECIFESFLRISRETRMLLRSRNAQIEQYNLLVQIIISLLALFGQGQFAFKMLVFAKPVRDQKPSEFRYQPHFSNHWQRINWQYLPALLISAIWYAVIESIWIRKYVLNSNASSVRPFSSFLFVLFLRSNVSRRSVESRTIPSRDETRQISFYRIMTFANKVCFAVLTSSRWSIKSFHIVSLR